MISKSFIPSKRPGEILVKHFWRHPIVFIKSFLMFVIIFSLPLFVYWLISNFSSSLLEHAIIYPLLVILFFSYYLFVLIFALNVWVDNYLDVWTLTNMRIISRTQLGWFNRVNSELELSKVQDVSVEQKGIFPTIFNYGNLHVQTAGTTERFLLRDVPNPIKVARLINRLYE